MLFFKKKEPQKPPTQDLPRAREELLMGDTNRTYTISDFIIPQKLFGLYGDIDRSLQQIFETGALDAENKTLFDGSIETASTIAQLDLNEQYALQPTRIAKMVAWRERDVKELEHQRERRLAEIEKAKKEYDYYKEKHDSLVNAKKSKKGDNINEKNQSPSAKSPNEKM